jgi:hypothetical protein
VAGGYSKTQGGRQPATHPSNFTRGKKNGIFTPIYITSLTENLSKVLDLEYA